jgi:hypothetical protein
MKKQPHAARRLSSPAERSDAGEGDRAQRGGGGVE